MSEDKPILLPQCPMEITLRIIGGKWKILILWYLVRKKILRFGELQKMLPEITQKMLTQQLRDLERDGLIHRKIYPEVPPKVEYSLTELGTGIVPILKMLCNWGEEYRQAYAGRDAAVSLESK